MTEPPELLTTDDVRRRYDALLKRHGLPPIYVPSDPSGDMHTADGTLKPPAAE